MKEYSIIIPTYNREKNLGCVLMSLLKQRDFDFDKMEIIIIDEGTMPAITTVKGFAEEINISYLWRKGTTGNPGQAKNWAVENAKGKFLIFLDSDVILNDKALHWYDALVKKYPGVIICGRYDWLLPMNINQEDVAERFNAVTDNGLPIICESGAGPLPGIDPRWQDSRIYKMDKPGGIFSLAMFGGNTLVPIELFRKSGGFDPNIKGHGGEDCELGWTMEEIGAKALFTEKTMGWHIWHSRNQEENEKAVKRNIKYIDAKHDIEKRAMAFPLVPKTSHGQELIEHFKSKEK